VQVGILTQGQSRLGNLGWMRIDYIRTQNLDAFSAIASLAFKDD
jgi:hypothetical protein